MIIHLQAVKIELDAKDMVGWMFGHHRGNTMHSLLISDCRYMMNLIPRVEVNHCFRETN